MAAELTPRNRAQQAAITMPNGELWAKRAMPPGHVEKLRELHACAGWDCSICVWLATFDAETRALQARVTELETENRELLNGALAYRAEKNKMGAALARVRALAESAAIYSRSGAGHLAGVSEFAHEVLAALNSEGPE